MNYPPCDFSGVCGQSKNSGHMQNAPTFSVTSAKGLQPDEQVSINGKIDLSGCIQADDGSCVYSVFLTRSPGYFDYTINVDAEGPHGARSGAICLKFTDESGDRYKLFVYSSTRSVHTVRYNSDAPAITKIEWLASA